MKKFEDKSWQEKCVDMMKQAEYDQKLMDGLIWLSKKAIIENKSLYQVIRETLILHHQQVKEKKN